MAEKSKNKSERSEVVSFWVNVFVVGVVMVVLGFYLGTYMLNMWQSKEAGTDADMGTTTQSANVNMDETEPVADVASVNRSSQSTSTINPTTVEDTVDDTTDTREPSTINPVNRLYKVQVGSFDDKSTAEVMATTLKKSGYNDAWVTTTDPIRVQVGAYSNPDNATKLVNELEDKGYTVHIVN